MTSTHDTSKHAASGCCGDKGTSGKAAPVGTTKRAPTPAAKPATPLDAVDAAAKGHTAAEHAKHTHEA
ncbi:MAG: hypothetical protein H7276_05845 [Caulobacter sp.]|nr:hypothetical protein [Vitreoscilla sp.]